MQELFLRLSRHPFITLELFVASLFANGLGLASTLYVIQLLNRYVSHGVDATLFTLTIGVCLAALFEYAFRRIRSRLAATVGVNRNRELMMESFGILTKGKVKDLDAIPKRTRQELMKGINSIEDAYKPSNLTALFDLPFSLLFIGVLFLLSPLLSLIAICFMIVMLLLACLSQYKLRTQIKQLTNISILANGIFAAANQSSDTLRLFDRSTLLMQRWKSNTEQFLNQRKLIADDQDILQSRTRILQVFLSIAIYAVGARLVVLGELNVGLLIGANILAARALAPIGRFAQLGDAFITASQALERIQQLENIETEKESGIAPESYQGELTVRDMAFQYPGMSQPLFESLNFELKPGSVLVVSGANGTGKTTLMRLLAGLIEPDRGQILADGVELRQLIPSWWRSNLILLPQEVGFLPATIGENIMTANPKLDAAGLNNVIQESGLAELIDKTPQGLNTPLSAGAEHIPVGHRKRIALARALATGGKLVLFDDPLEGLDAKGCQIIYSLLLKLSRAGHTIIVFTQDPHIIKSAIRILDLNIKPVPTIHNREAKTM